MNNEDILKMLEKNEQVLKEALSENLKAQEILFEKGYNDNGATRKKVIDLIKSDGMIRQSKLRKYSRLKTSALSIIIDKLKEEGRIREKVEGRTTFYIAI